MRTSTLASGALDRPLGERRAGNVGGHAYLAYGVNTSRGYVSIRNSWGADWGSNGNAKISLDDLSKLLAADGECAVATEVRL